MASTLMIQLAFIATIVGCVYTVGIYEQCAGEGYGTFPCDAGLTCFRRNKWYSSCQYSCPRNVGWECEAALPPVPVSTIAAGWEQCGGDGWLGPAVCATGYACYARSVYYSQCRPVNDCPAGWICAPVSATTSPSAPVVLAPYAPCHNVGNAICPSGTACFRFNANYAECRPSCPSTWACETEVAVLGQQCGGSGFVGITRCADGLGCYALNQYHSRCAYSCPNSSWLCYTQGK